MNKAGTTKPLYISHTSGLAVSVYYSDTDGRLVVDLLTDEMASTDHDSGGEPTMRVYVNDGLVYPKARNGQ